MLRKISSTGMIQFLAQLVNLSQVLFRTSSYHVHERIHLTLF